MNYGDFSKIWDDLKKKRFGKVIVYALIVIILFIGSALIMRSSETGNKTAIPPKKDDTATKNEPFSDKPGKKQGDAPQHATGKIEDKRKIIEKPSDGENQRIVAVSQGDINAELTIFFDSISSAIATQNWERVRQSFPLFQGLSPHSSS